MDTGLIVILSAVTLLILLLVVAILKGWGDGKIAGINMTKAEKRDQFNTKRLRAVVAAMLLMTVTFMWFLPLMGDTAVLWALMVPFGIFIIGIILASTWCKKK